MPPSEPSRKRSWPLPRPANRWQAEVIDLDQHATLPWTGADGAGVAAAAGDPLLAAGEYAVAAIGEGCRFGVELTAAQLAAGLRMLERVG